MTELFTISPNVSIKTIRKWSNYKQTVFNQLDKRQRTRIMEQLRNYVNVKQTNSIDSRIGAVLAKVVRKIQIAENGGV